MTLAYMLYQGSGNNLSGGVGHTCSVVAEAAIPRNTDMLVLALAGIVRLGVERAVIRRHADVLKIALVCHRLPPASVIMLEVALLASRGLPGGAREQRKNERDCRKRREHRGRPFKLVACCDDSSVFKMFSTGQHLNQ